MIRLSQSSEEATHETRSALDELVQTGARRMLQHALEAEVESYIASHASARDAAGHALVVRHGPGRPRSILTGAGVLAVTPHRVNDKRVVDGERQRFRSLILPPYLRKSTSVSELLPALYLRGMSTGDFRDGLSALLGEEAKGLSPSVITRLTKTWQDELAAWRTRPLGDYVYIWADGVHFNVRLEDERLSALVIIGVREDGTKEVVGLDDGYRESTESWASMLRDLKSRGMKAPCVAVGDGALGFWAALAEVFPETREQLCWVHKIANVLDKLPKSLQPKAKEALHEMMRADTRESCEKLMKTFEVDYGAKYPKAVNSLLKNSQRLMTLYDFPAEHWRHLRTTNPIESSFATVRLRTNVTKGAGSRSAGLAMAFRLLLLAQASWRKLNAPALLAAIRNGAVYINGLAKPQPTQPSTHDEQIGNNAA